MMPDKIYLNTPKIQPELDNTTWDTKTYADCENVEYIRKDVVDEMVKSAEDHAFFAGQEKFREKLLEWANTMKRICKRAEPIEKAYQTMIDKIESL